jgi:hypothetical protein
MARPRKHPEGLTRTVSFKLSDADYLTYEAKVKASGLPNSDFFREVVLTNKTQITAKPQKSEDRKRLVFLFDKSSNNLNQLAHRANTDYLAGRLSESVYEQLLLELENIGRYLEATLPNVD